MLLLYARGPKGELCEPIQGQTRLMKMVFLFKRELSRRFNLAEKIDDTAFPDFVAFDYGPYSAQVYSDLEFLVNLEFVEVLLQGEPEIIAEERAEFEHWSVTTNTDEDLDNRYLGREFRLTQIIGKGFVEEELVRGLGFTDEQLRVLHEFKKRCCEATLRSLLRYVYTRHGDMTVKSKIRDEVLG